MRRVSALLVVTAFAALATVAMPALAGAADRAGDRQIADDSILSAQEVPPGFEVTPSSDDEPSSVDAVCTTLERGRKALNAAPNAEIDFLQTPADGSGSARINNQISVFAKTKAAKAAYAAYAGPDSEECFATTYEQGFLAQVDDPDAKAVVTTERYDPDLGDASVGYELKIHLTAGGDSETFYIDLELSRVGRALSGFAFLDTGEPFSSDDEVSMTDAVTERLETALEGA